MLSSKRLVPGPGPTASRKSSAIWLREKLTSVPGKKRSYPPPQAALAVLLKPFFRAKGTRVIRTLTGALLLRSRAVKAGSPRAACSGR